MSTYTWPHNANTTNPAALCYFENRADGVTITGHNFFSWLKWPVNLFHCALCGMWLILTKENNK